MTALIEIIVALLAFGYLMYGCGHCAVMFTLTVLARRLGVA